MRVRRMSQVIGISILIISACTSNDSAERMPVTTDSELALELYETGLIAFDQLKWDLAWHNFEYAIEQDPDFFMAHFWMYLMTTAKSKKVAENAFQIEVELNEGEVQVKTALKYLLEGQEKKVVEHLEELITMYPYDPHVHKILYFLQSQYMKDSEGAIETILKTIDVLPDYAPAYNYLGYAYMDLKEYELAEEALDNYIRLAPGQANPYDSKGDYYMEVEEYEKAFESYLKAYELDSSFEISKKKALKAQQMMEKVIS